MRILMTDGRYLAINSPWIELATANYFRDWGPSVTIFRRLQGVIYTPVTER